MNSAQIKRFDAMVSLSNEVFSIDGTMILTDRGIIAEKINNLKPLGRTERWRNAVDAWSAMVLEEDNDLGWAYAQYGHFATIASVS